MNSFVTNCGIFRLNLKIGIYRFFPIPVMLAVLLLASCAPVRPPVLPLPPVSADTLLQTLRAQAQRFQTLQGTVLLRMTNGGKRQSAKQVLLMQRPNLFRAEVLGPFGQPVMTVAADGDLLFAFIPGEGRFFSGPATSDNLYRLVRLPMELEQLVQFVFCDVPLLPDATGSVWIEDGFYRLDRQSSDGRRQELFFDSQRQLRQVRYFSGETQILQAFYDDIRQEDGLAKTLRLIFPAVDMEVELVWRDVRVNGKIPSSRFHLEQPPGVQVLALP